MDIVRFRGQAYIRKREEERAEEGGGERARERARSGSLLGILLSLNTKTFVGMWMDLSVDKGKIILSSFKCISSYIFVGASVLFFQIFFFCFFN